MIISQEELTRRLQSSKNLKNTTLPNESRPFSTAKVEEIRPPDKPPEQPREAKILSGILARVGDGSVQEIAKEFGVSVKQINKNQKLPEVSATVERVRELALDKLMCALNFMSPEMFRNSDLKDLSTVAANMSRIIEKTNPREANSGIQLLVYAPVMRDEKHYKVVDI